MPEDLGRSKGGTNAPPVMQAQLHKQPMLASEKLQANKAGKVYHLSVFCTVPLCHFALYRSTVLGGAVILGAKMYRPEIEGSAHALVHSVTVAAFLISHLCFVSYV